MGAHGPWACSAGSPPRRRPAELPPWRSTPPVVVRIRLPDQGFGLVLGLAAYLAAMDLGEYLFHRAQHAIPALWAMHSLHHSDPAVNVATTTRHFWLKSAIKSLTIWLAVGLLFGASPKIVALYGLATLYNMVLHGNLRLGFGRFSSLVNSPQYHRLHHSRDPAWFNCNFAALLSVWDVIAGSYRPPEPGQFALTGLEDRPPPANLLGDSRVAFCPRLARQDVGRPGDGRDSRIVTMFGRRKQSALVQTNPSNG